VGLTARNLERLLARNRTNKLGWTTQFNYLPVQFFDAISSVQLLTANDWHALNFYEYHITYLLFIMHSTLHKLKSSDVLLKQF